jgi:hypothetical protein
VARTGNKTVRFAQVVERSGQPHVHTLWMAPEKDPELKRAQQAHRVMRVAPGGAGKTDVGTVGFERGQKEGQLLIFPKSLQRFEGARVVGIKFDLVEQPKLADAADLKEVAQPKNVRGKKPKPAPRPTIAATVEEPEPTRAPEVEPERQPDPEPAPEPPPRVPKAKRSSHAATKPEPARDSALVREVRAALKDLQRGKSVAAYQRLERAIQ